MHGGQMACLNDALVSVTLNELAVVCDLLVFFSYGHFMAHHEANSPCVLDMHPLRELLGIPGISSTRTLGISCRDHLCIHVCYVWQPMLTTLVNLTLATQAPHTSSSYLSDRMLCDMHNKEMIELKDVSSRNLGKVDLWLVIGLEWLGACFG